MNNLNVFRTQYTPWNYPSNWIRNAQLFFRQFKWAYQRITRGFCDFDTWDLDCYLTELLAQSIEHLAKNTHSYPGSEEFPTYESWEEYLMKIVEKLKYSSSELPNEYEEAWLRTWDDKDLKDAFIEKNPEDEEITHKYFEKEFANEKLKKEAQDEALKMIYHVYDQLWD